MICSFHRRTESEICFEQNASYVRNSSRNHPVTNIKKTKEFFSDIGFIITQNAN